MYAAAFDSRKAGVNVNVKVLGVGCRSVVSQLYNDGTLCCTIALMPQSESKGCCVESMSCLSMGRRYLISIQRLGTWLSMVPPCMRGACVRACSLQGFVVAYS